MARRWAAAAAVALVGLLGFTGAAGTAMAHHGDPLGVHLCTGMAPQSTSCTTGDHASVIGLFSHGFDAPGYTGTLRSTLAYAGGARVTTCHIQLGVLGGCVSTGAFPPVGADFSQVCESFALGTTTPGGDGVWACRLVHV